MDEGLRPPVCDVMGCLQAAAYALTDCDDMRLEEFLCGRCYALLVVTHPERVSAYRALPSMALELELVNDEMPQN